MFFCKTIGIDFQKKILAALLVPTKSGRHTTSTPYSDFSLPPEAGPKSLDLCGYCKNPPKSPFTKGGLSVIPPFTKGGGEGGF